jgi:hypothetical protein
MILPALMLAGVAVAEGQVPVVALRGLLMGVLLEGLVAEEELSDEAEKEGASV